jgi:phytoene dehydrogenase-like protein
MMKKVIVIGAGISGLSAAIYAQRSGFDVTICEQHSIPGGMCTSWKRKNYLFEGAIHWMTGSSPKTELYQLWKETGALNDKEKVFLKEPFYAVEWEGQIINLYRDIKKTIKQLIVLSPADTRQLRRLASDVKAFSSVQMPIFDIKGVKAQHPKRMSLITLLKMLPAFPMIKRLSNISCEDYVKQYKHPAIQRLLCFLPGNYSAISLIGTLSTLNMGDGGYPDGGSLATIARMRKTYEDLGGKLLLSTRVKKVNIENGAATGVTLENGILAADAVIVCQETIAALDQLFDTPPRDAWVSDIRKNSIPAVCTFVGMGIRAEIPQGTIPTWKLEEPIMYAGTKLSEIRFFNYSGHEGYAPKGCSVITTAIMGDTYDFWEKTREEGRYEEEKRKLADQMIRVIEKKYPQAEGNIEVIDIATPLTYERYTGAYHGSWMSISGVGNRLNMYPGYLEGVNGLYFAGHRLMAPGGLPVAVDTGRKAAQMVCRQFDVMFKNV